MSATASDEQLRILLETPAGRRQLSMASPVFFDHHYCGMRYAKHRDVWLSRFAEMRRLARERDDKVRLLQLAPRDHGKTEFAITLATMSVCEDRNVRILWISEAAGAAQKRLRRVKALLESARIQADWCTAPDEGFGPFYQDNGIDKWTDSMVQVTRTLQSVDPTIEAVGSGGQVTGGHFDIILCDDLEDDRTTFSSGERKKTREWFLGTVGPMLSPGGVMIVIGTRKHADDLYAHLAENQMWRKIEDPAILEWPESFSPILDDEGKVTDYNVVGGSRVLWPEERPIKYLLKERHNVGPRFFAREWLHQIQDDSTAQIKWEWIEAAKKRGAGLSLYKLPPGVKLHVVQGWDFALATDAKKAETNKTDYSVGITLGRAANGDRYLLGINRRRGMTPKQLVANVKAEFARFRGKVSTVRVERNAFGELHYLGLQESTDLPLRPHTTTGTNKLDPFDGLPALALLFENGKIIIPCATPQDQEDVEPLLQELYGLGKERHDDTVLALWIAELAVRDEQFTYQVAMDDEDFDVVPKDRRPVIRVLQGGGSAALAERQVRDRVMWEDLPCDLEWDPEDE